MTWTERNQVYLGEVLRRCAALLRGEAVGHDRPDWPAVEGDLPALEVVCHCFDLSPFERSILVLAAGVELDSAVAGLVDGRPTLATALAGLPDPHWSALAPSGPLRHWGLVELEPGHPLTASPLRIDERVLHYLAGVDGLDARLQPIATPVGPGRTLPPSQQLTADRVAAVLGSSGRRLGPVVLTGPDAGAKRDVTAAAAGALGLRALVVDGPSIPTTADDLQWTARLLAREAVIAGQLILVEATVAGPVEPALLDRVLGLVDQLPTPAVLAMRSQPPVSGSSVRATPVAFEVAKPTREEQAAIWEVELEAELGSCAPDHSVIDTLTSRFDLDANTIEAAVAVAGAVEGGADTVGRLWSACRRQARPTLDGLAQMLDAPVTLDDVVLSTSQRATLDQMVGHVAGRTRIYDEWGFGQRSHRGRGISALFSGPSGTGKTMAAEALAGQLDLDLWRIDLSQVVSKYIGETEKNLARVFDAAEAGTAVLLFDEADALFGKRSEVRDSHDRYANIEVSYLLQRIEAFTGLAILTTNQEQALDDAFLRRIRFVVRFAAPDQAARRAIWAKAFPEAVPRDPLDLGELGGVNLTGGNINNIAMAAAFRAAAADRPVEMDDVRTSARAELAKLGRRATSIPNGSAGEGS